VQATWLGRAGADGPKPLAEPELTAKERAHWAFQKPVRPQVPTVRDTVWIRTPVDRFVLSRLEGAGLLPSPPADRARLLRRVTFDLVGLPPTPEELESFLNDDRPDAYARAVERLLASPHYGERWAQHWLDVARYAESNGYETDSDRLHAWRYRDYVIRAFNEDKPYDRFLTEQLAGDQLLRGQDPKQDPELLIATAFNRCGPVHLVSGNTDPDVNRQEVLTEMTNGLSSVFLGLTISCARCHDHKFDPISQADYYRLQSFFAAAQPKDVDISREDEHAAHAERMQKLESQLAPLRKQLADLEAPHRARLTEAKKARLEPAYREPLAVDAAKRTPEQKKLAEHAHILLKITWDELLEALTPSERSRRAALRERIHALETRKPPPPAQAWALKDDEKPPPTYLLLRGDPKRKGAEVQPAFPRVLAPRGVPSAGLDRLALANWLTTPEHPLTARVLVNRIWQHHFGRGIVATPNDFGVRGSPPSHPKLLDWLTCELVEHAWSLKHLHRLIVLSSTYQQSSRPAATGLARKVDPDNRLLGRMLRRRLEGEVLRDQVLAVAGSLNPKLSGPPVRLPLEPEVYALIFTEGEPDGLWPVTADPREHFRRSIYLFNKRNVRLPLLEAFDQPDTLTSCPVRPVSTFAPQALIMLNGPFLQEQAKHFAARLLRECGTDIDQQIDRACRLALARPAKESEVRMAREFLASGSQDGAAALADFCLALLNRNEFIFVD
jgi:hypothetical protein